MVYTNMACTPEQARKNGMKGGRKKGVSTLEAEKAREYIANRIGDYMPAIFEALVNKAVTGDVMATKELLDRAFGKSVQPSEIYGKGGKDLVPDSSTDKIAQDALLTFINEITRNPKKR